MDPKDPKLVAGALVAVALLALIIKEKLGRALLQRRLAAAEAELAALKEAATKREYSLERFEALWFPMVTRAPDGRAVSAVAGLPYCKACVQPLTLAAGEWTCRSCGKRLPESLADNAVTDAVVKQALDWARRRPATS